MPTQPCDNVFNRPVAQTIFLGASVTSFNNNLGWGTQPSQLTVNLVEDKKNKMCDPNSRTPGIEDYDQFPPLNSSTNRPNHYYNCEGVSCYVDRYTGRTATDTTPTENRILPGKVYYELDENLGLVSKYMIKPDPGFFGNQTIIDPKGERETGPNEQIYKYDIIDTPVYFKMGDFQFGGFVQSWNKNLGANGEQYTVIINSAQALLNSSYIIIDKYAGTIFSYIDPATSFYGVPSNYLGALGNHNADIYRGALPNVFNLYGFAESFGKDNFGTALVNEQGMSVNMVLESLMILTSTIKARTRSGQGNLLDVPLRDKEDPNVTKRAFSTFGRLISKCMAQDFPDAFSQIEDSFNKYGVVNPQDSTCMRTHIGAQRCEFLLDLNDVIYTDSTRTTKRFPDAIRVPGPSLSITELLNFIGDKFGLDFFVDMVPVVIDRKIHNVIKVKCISRLIQPRANIIENTIKELECSGIPVSSNSIGKEKNDVSSRCLLIGGPQQRLYQVKSYRLAYTQNNFIYNPRTREFVDYKRLQNATADYGYGKFRFPDFMSIRNPLIYDYYGVSSDITDSEKKIIATKGNGFTSTDARWNSTPELRSGLDITYGNYDPAIKVPTPTVASSVTSERWFPLYLDTICPFFGYFFDGQIGVQAGENSNTDLRTIRPVWYDTWTAQIGVICRVAELPQLNVKVNRVSLESHPTLTDSNGWKFDLPSVQDINARSNVYGNLGVISSYSPVEYFVITESEIRAALAGFDNFLVYCLAKTYKTDLIEMVRRAYYIKARNELLSANTDRRKAEETAYKETDWYWKLLGANIAGDELYPTVVFPDKNDGSQYIQEKALQDLKIIHKFVLDVAKYYGKRYMVSMPYMRASRESFFSTPVAYTTNVGYGYIFSGPPGDLRYNYVPTNDGAWEEYGNMIDDSIVVGSVNWMSLTGDMGKIRPILGYNNNSNYDYVRQAKCLAASNSNVTAEFVREKANPYFSFSNWLTLLEHKTTQCTESYVFPSLDLSSLGGGDYVMVNQLYSDPESGASQEDIIRTGSNIVSLQLTNTVKPYDAWGNEIKLPGINPLVGTSLAKSKVYVPASLQENVIFLDPTNLAYPKVLIDSPGLNLNLSSEENAKDPNRTVISNIAAEDLMLYLKTNMIPDPSFVLYMLNYIAPLVLDDSENPYFLGVYTVSANHTANNVELAPKAAHPFFAGIPIKSNQFAYGPWTNYPYINYGNIFPPGQTVVQTDTIPRQCSFTSIDALTSAQGQNAIDNMINGVQIEFNDDLVPWNYGGMINLDRVAFNEIATKISYQSVMETAQIEMPGLPIFSLGGNFVLANRNLKYTVGTNSVFWYDKKVKGSFSSGPASYGIGNIYFSEPAQSISTITATYNLINLTDPPAFTPGPIISAIGCSVGQQGIVTTYTFRTYTRKLSLFNKEDTDRIKKFNMMNMSRGKQISQIYREINNLKNKEREVLLQERLNKAEFGSSDLSSKLFGWSPGTVIIGQAVPLIDEPVRSPKYIENHSYSSNPGNTSGPATSQPPTWELAQTSDVGNNYGDNFALTDANSPTLLRKLGRITSTVQLFERKEVNNQLDKDYGSQSAMSLDGLLSPISFYPTFKNATFSYSLHQTANCPFCKGTKRRTIRLVQYSQNSKRYRDLEILCDKCTNASNSLNAKLSSKNPDDPDKPAINLITLNPLVVPYGEFKQYNSQNYTGAHPEGKHADLTSLSRAFNSSNPRSFRDRLRHSIEIVARGSIPQNKIGYALETSRNNNATNPEGAPDIHLDYAANDEALYALRSKVPQFDPNNIMHANNQRFFSLRGPLTLHSWGYDDEGYPVPNAADEPLAYDEFGRPKRFKVKRTIGASKKYKDLENGKSFSLINSSNAPIFVKSYNGENLPSSITDNSLVYPVTIENDMSSDGGFEPSDYQGDIIGKTQKFVGGKWTAKVKLKEFYLNWSERPDLWRVGPVHMVWDSKNMIWTHKGGCEELMPPYIVTNSNDITTLTEFFNNKKERKCPYKMIYATLEEDLIKQPDFDETFATRAFIDDIEFSKEPLLKGFRRLIYIKDKCAYTAPMGTKLLCRYNRDTGFYEPVTKPSVMAKGKISSGSKAIIDLNYIQGRRSGKIPSKTITFDNPLSFSTPTNSLGIFTFIYGKWTLTAIKS